MHTKCCSMFPHPTLPSSSHPCTALPGRAITLPIDALLAFPAQFKLLFEPFPEYLSIHSWFLRLVGDLHVVTSPVPQPPFLPFCLCWPRFPPAQVHFAAISQALFLSLTAFSVFTDIQSWFWGSNARTMRSYPYSKHSSDATGEKPTAPCAAAPWGCPGKDEFLGLSIGPTVNPAPYQSKRCVISSFPLRFSPSEACTVALQFDFLSSRGYLWIRLSLLWA